MGLVTQKSNFSKLWLLPLSSIFHPVCKHFGSRNLNLSAFLSRIWHTLATIWILIGSSRHCSQCSQENDQHIMTHSAIGTAGSKCFCYLQYSDPSLELKCGWEATFLLFISSNWQHVFAQSWKMSWHQLEWSMEVSGWLVLASGEGEVQPASENLADFFGIRIMWGPEIFQMAAIRYFLCSASQVGSRRATRWRSRNRRVCGRQSHNFFVQRADLLSATDKHSAGNAEEHTPWSFRAVL